MNTKGIIQQWLYSKFLQFPCKTSLKVVYNYYHYITSLYYNYLFQLVNLYLHRDIC